MDIFSRFGKPVLISTLPIQDVMEVNNRQGGTFLYLSQMHNFNPNDLAVLWAMVEKSVGGRHALECSPKALNALPYLMLQLQKGNLTITQLSVEYQVYSKISLEKMQKKIAELTGD